MIRPAPHGARASAEFGVLAVLFDVNRGELVDAFGESGLATLPAAAFPPLAADTDGARLLRTVGAPTGTLRLRAPDEETGRLPAVGRVVDTGDFEDAPPGARARRPAGPLPPGHLGSGVGVVEAHQVVDAVAVEVPGEQVAVVRAPDVRGGTARSGDGARRGGGAVPPEGPLEQPLAGAEPKTRSGCPSPSKSPPTSCSSRIGSMPQAT
ncbi:hypothetical protein STENM327S_08575 [Streptomyces tendae]